MTIRKANRNDYDAIMHVWESAVKATHDFLADEDFLYFKEKIPTDYLPAVELYVLTEEEIKGFVGVSGDMLEMLFIHAGSRGKGYGKTLLQYALDHLQITKVDVNEQNTQAVGFYEKMGFKQIDRSEKDAMGKDYPILHFRFAGNI
ncbi:MAG: GNAT family N-acetyltransferase [Tannerella sp.]|jgi:putative acetyltransferase|nr:GNAT family N-acetyltransferase [Tannerella sp.]